MMSEAKPGPLRGIRVMDLTGERGAYCGKLLADLDADVIKVEPPRGCETRGLPPFVDDQPDPDGSLFFLYHNTNKRGITLDITKVEGQRLFAQLASTADVVVESHAVDHLDGLGLGYDSLSRQNPRLVMTSITPFGQTGPHRHFKGPDIVPLAMSGLMNMLGEPDGVPVNAGARASYVLAGVSATAATLMAIFQRHATKRGQHVDVSIQECVSASVYQVSTMLYDGLRFSRMFRYPDAVPFANFPTENGYVNILIGRPWHWDILAKWVHEVTGNAEILGEQFKGHAIHRLPHEKQIYRWVADFTRRFTKERLVAEGQKLGLPLGPVNTTADLLQDPHLKEREFFVEVESREGRRFTYPGAPYRFSESPWAIRRGPPKLGQHNTEVYRDELGMSGTELGSLRAMGVL